MFSINKCFIFFSISFIVGVFVTNTIRDYLLSLYLVLFITILLVNFYIFTKRYFFYLIFILIGLVFGFIIAYINIININEKQSYINKYTDNTKHKVLLQIQRVYKKKKYDISYMGVLKELDNIKVDKKIKVLLKTKINFNLEKGELIEFSTKIELVENFSDNFDYKSFLESKQVFLILNSYDFYNKGSVSLNKWEIAIMSTRQKMLSIINTIYPRNEAVFLGGILIGSRESIPEEMSTSFNNSGLTHLIAVSGFNITIIIVFLSYILSYFPVILRVTLTTLFIVFFTGIVGDSSAVIRASIMGLIGYYILVSGRKGDTLTIILFTGIIMLLINPFLINYDISFQLSYLAVFGLLYTQGFFEKIFFFLPSKFAIKESFVLTLSAFTFTLPIMIFNFGQVSVLAPIANMLVGWSIPFAMFFGFLSIIGYMINPTIGYIIGFIDYFLLKWTTSIGYFFGNLDFVVLKIELGFYAVYFEIIYFILLLFFILHFRKE